MAPITFHWDPWGATRSSNCADKPAPMTWTEGYLERNCVNTSDTIRSITASLASGATTLDCELLDCMKSKPENPGLNLPAKLGIRPVQIWPDAETKSSWPAVRLGIWSNSVSGRTWSPARHSIRPNSVSGQKILPDTGVGRRLGLLAVGR